MTDTKELTALRQELENWKAIVTEQSRRLDDLANKQDRIWNLGYYTWASEIPDPAVSITKSMPVWWFEFRNENKKMFDEIIDQHFRLVVLEKHCFPGIHEKKPPKLMLVATDGKNLADDPQED